MKKGWNIEKLSEVCLINPKKNEARLKLNDEDLVSFLPMSDLGITEKTVIPKQQQKFEDVYSGYTYFANNDVLLAKVTPCFENGKLGVVHNLTNNCGFGSSEYIVLRALENILPEYLFYFLSTQQFRELGAKLMFGAAGLKRLSKDYVYNTLIKYPPLSEQQRLVEILDHAFAKIDALKQNTERNLQNAKELFQIALKNEFDLGLNNLIPLKNICEITSSKRIFKSEYVEKGIPFYRTKEIKELANGDNISLELFISIKRYTEIKQQFGIPQRGDILISAVGTIGEVYVINDDKEFYFKDGNIVWLKNFKEAINSNFLKYMLKSFVEKLKSLSRGAAYSALTIEKLKEIEIPPYSFNKQKQIVAKLDALSAKCKELENNYQRVIDNCDELKQAILRRAFNGEL